MLAPGLPFIHRVVREREETDKGDSERRQEEEKTEREI